MDRRWSATDR